MENKILKHMFDCAKMLYHMTSRADRILIFSVFAAAVFLALVFLKPQGSEGTAFAVIEQDGKEILRLQLDREESVRISCTNGYNVVTVSGGSVAVTEADCRDQVCVRQGEISSGRETIVCLPHRLAVRLERADDGTGPDAVTN